MINEILLIPEKIDIERDIVASCWEENGGEVQRIGKFWEKPIIDSNKRITIYGTDTFSLVLAQVLGLQLIAPRDELIGELENRWVQRKIEILQITEIKNFEFPTFIKPVKPKTFKSQVYHTFESFCQETQGIEENELVIKSDIIEIESEVRAFILKGEILDLAIYEGDADLYLAKEFLLNFLKNHSINLPSTYVIDIGYHKIKGWFIIEFNASWGAGLNSCDPYKVIRGIREATL